METIVQTTWQKSKLIIKGLIIGALALLLLVPADFVQNLIKEREARQKEAFIEVSSKWANRQNITGPVLVIPYTKAAKDNNGLPVTIKSFAYFLPDKLNIASAVRPEKRYRGIYEVMLYSSSIKLDGSFAALPLQKLNLTPADMVWNEAYVCLGITDAKGLKDELQLTWNDSILSLTPSAVNSAALSPIGNVLFVTEVKPAQYPVTYRTCLHIAIQKYLAKFHHV